MKGVGDCRSGNLFCFAIFSIMHIPSLGTNLVVVVSSRL